MTSAASSNMPTAAEILDCEFLELRANLLKVAAQLDRIDRAPGTVSSDARLRGVDQALAVLAGASPKRAEQVQMIFCARTIQVGKRNWKLARVEFFKFNDAGSAGASPSLTY